MGIQGFSHVGVCCSDLERSTRFYTDVLGFTEIFTMEMGDEVAATMELDGIYGRRHSSLLKATSRINSVFHRLKYVALNSVRSTANGVCDSARQLVEAASTTTDLGSPIWTTVERDLEEALTAFHAAADGSLGLGREKL